MENLNREKETIQKYEMGGLELKIKLSKMENFLL
jgi:hypothetical protein